MNYEVAINPYLKGGENVTVVAIKMENKGAILMSSANCQVTIHRIVRTPLSKRFGIGSHRTGPNKRHCQEPRTTG